jgi:hypothetical protein
MAMTSPVDLNAIELQLNNSEATPLRVLGNSSSSPERAAKVRSIKDWARAELGLPDHVVVMATELRCTEPGCPPLETVVAILRDGRQQQFKIHKALADIVAEDVRAGAHELLEGRGRAHGPEQTASSADQGSETSPSSTRP